MERIIYQTKVFTGINIFILIGMTSFFTVILLTDDTFDIETDYPSILGILAIYLVFIIHRLKKFTLTENEFIVEYPPLAFALKPERIPLNDIEKMVFGRTPGLKPITYIEIYRAGREISTRFRFFTLSVPNTYYYSIDWDEDEKLSKALKRKGVQVDDSGSFWK